MLLTEEGEGPEIFKYIFQKSFEMEFHLLYFGSTNLYCTVKLAIARRLQEGHAVFLLPEVAPRDGGHQRGGGDG